MNQAISDQELLKRAIEKVEILASLSADEKTALAEKLQYRRGKSGQFILREGTPERDLLFIVEGQAKVCRADSDGKEVIVSLMGPGDFIGEIALLTKAPRGADVVALLPTVTLMLTADDFFKHIQRWSGLGINMLRAMAIRVQRATNLITDLALYDVCCRVARALWGMGTLETDGELQMSVVRDAPTHQMLASMVGSSREVVSRAMRSLEQGGHIEVDEDRVFVRSLP